MSEFDIETQLGSIRVVQSGKPDGVPVIALHGWLDNAASFEPLAEHLQQLKLYALDLAGHGFSYHRGFPYNYNIWDDLLDIDQVADALGLEQFCLLGHSRGAMIALLYAASSPERILKLGLLDGYINIISDIDDTAKILARYRNKRMRGRKRLTVYNQLDEMIGFRQQGYLAVGERAARVLVERNVLPVDGGYVWRTDQALRWSSAVHLNAAQGAAITRSLACPTHLWLAQDSFERSFTAEQFAQQNALISYSIEAGRHHFHMECDVAGVAAKVDAFFAAQEH